MSHPNREADRLRVIIKSIAYTDPDMRMADAADAIFEIEARTFGIEQMALNDAPKMAGIVLPDQTPETIARFIDLQPDIQALAPSKKINAIKEVRALTSVGLKEAKEGVEHWVSTRPKAHYSPTAAAAAGRTLTASMSDIADWIDGQADIIRLLTGSTMLPSPKIHAIKETRVRHPAGPSLKEAKDGVEHWMVSKGYPVSSL